MEIEFRQVRKSFGSGRSLHLAVQGASWRASGGEVFGLLGPNGAGKTTMIRMLLDIIRPDCGQILVDGYPEGNWRLEFRRRVGYLPEERGLYLRRKVLDVLVYLARLKGISRKEARARAGSLLERFELADYATKKVGDLSKGMSQKIQIASCILHDPELVVLDEPFFGLDPVNVRLVRELIMDLKTRGKLVFLSTHMMGEVEVLCDRIFMLHQGAQVLYGDLRAIKRSHADHDVLLDLEAQPEGLSCVERVRSTPAGKCVYLRARTTLFDLLAELGAQKRPVRRIEEATASLEDIFVSLIKGEEPSDDQTDRNA